MSVRDGRRAAPGGRTTAIARAPPGLDRVRQNDGGRRPGHAVRLRSTARAALDVTAERGLRGRGRVGRVVGSAPRVPVDVRTVIVSRAPGQPAGGRRRLAANAGRPFPPRHRRFSRPTDVHENRRICHLMTKNTENCLQCFYYRTRENRNANISLNTIAFYCFYIYHVVPGAQRTGRAEACSKTGVFFADKNLSLLFTIILKNKINIVVSSKIIGKYVFFFPYNFIESCRYILISFKYL